MIRYLTRKLLREKTIHLPRPQGAVRVQAYAVPGFAVDRPYALKKLTGLA